MGLDDLGRKYKGWRRRWHEWWLGFKVIAGSVAIVAAIIFIVYVLVTS